MSFKRWRNVVGSAEVFYKSTTSFTLSGTTVSRSDHTGAGQCRRDQAGLRTVIFLWLASVVLDEQPQQDPELSAYQLT